MPLVSIDKEDIKLGTKMSITASGIFQSALWVAGLSGKNPYGLDEGEKGPLEPKAALRPQTFFSLVFWSIPPYFFLPLHHTPP